MSFLEIIGIGNPKVFDHNNINKNNKKTFGELYEKTVKKINDLFMAGYIVKFIWEADFKAILRERKNIVSTIA